MFSSFIALLTSSSTPSARKCCSRSQLLNFRLSNVLLQAILPFSSWDLDWRDSPVAPEALCRHLTPLETLFWFCPPLPPERKTSLSQSLGVILKKRALSIFSFLVALVTGPELEQAVESHEQAEELHLRESIRFPRGLQVSSIVNLFFCQARETGVDALRSFLGKPLGARPTTTTGP